MDLEDQLRRTHEDLSPFAEDLRRRVSADPAHHIVRPSHGAHVPPVTRLFQYPVQPWPLLVGAAKREQLARAAVGLVRLLRELPTKLFGDDPDRLAVFFGIPDSQKVAVTPPTGLTPDFGLARLDLIDDGTELKLLEANMAASLGGWELRFWREWVESTPAVAELFAASELRPQYGDVLDRLFRYVLGATRERSGGSSPALHVAFVVGSEALVAPLSEAFQPVFRQALGPGASGRLTVTTWGGFQNLGGRLALAGEPVQAVYDHGHEVPPLEVFRALRLGHVVFFNPWLHRMLGNKKLIALLSTAAEDPALSSADRALVAAHVPWTRALAPGTVRWRGRPCLLPELLLEEQERFVIKGERSVGGSAVVVGRGCGVAAWEEAVDNALADGTWLVQEYVASRPYHLQGDDGRPVPHDAVWGLFVFGDEYAGAYLRAMPRGRGDGVINGSRGASESLVFDL